MSDSNFFPPPGYKRRDESYGERECWYCTSEDKGASHPFSVWAVGVDAPDDYPDAPYCVRHTTHNKVNVVEHFATLELANDACRRWAPGKVLSPRRMSTSRPEAPVARSATLTVEVTACPWCKRAHQVAQSAKGGQPSRYCSERCKECANALSRMGSALRLWVKDQKATQAEAAVARGKVMSLAAVELNLPKDAGTRTSGTGGEAAEQEPEQLGLPL